MNEYPDSLETVAVRNKVLYVDGVKQDEPYVIHDDDRIIPREISVRDNFGPIVIPKGHIFMMGDNRDNSWTAASGVRFRSIS